MAVIVLGSLTVEAEADDTKTAELVAVLRSSASDVAAKARACQQLAIIGTDAAIPDLGALLTDERLAHYAREALEAMARPSADAALRTGLERAQGRHLVGIVNSLGMRRDAAAVPALEKLAQDDRSPATAAALLALARIGTIDAARTVRKSLDARVQTLRAAAAEAALLIADRFLAERKSDAVSWYDAVRAADVPEQLKLSALRGVILARGAGGVSVLVESLRASDGEVQAVALRAIRDLGVPEVTPAVVKAMDALTPAVQARALAALVDRRDERALPMIEHRATAADPLVRLAALKALGQIGRESSVPLLLAALSKEGGVPAEIEAAQRSLAQLQLARIDETIAGAASTARGPAKLRLIAVLGDRGSAAATVQMLIWARDPDPAVARSALRALALLARPTDLPALIELSLALQQDDVRTLADRAIYAASMKILEPERRAEPVLRALRDAKDPATRAALLRPFGAVVRAMGGNDAARELAMNALQDRDERVRTAAVRCLAEWPDASPAQALLEFLQAQPTPEQRGFAFDGVARMATEVAAGRDKAALDALATFTRLNAIARTDDERMKVVSGLGSVRRIEAYRMLVAYLEVPTVSTEAALAIVQIAPPLLNGKESAAVKRTLEQIAQTEKDADVRRQAARLAKGELPPKKGKKQK